MIGVTLNTGNTENIRRLIEGSKFNPEEIKAIRDHIMDNPKYAAFVEGTWDLMEHMRPYVAKAFEATTGVKFKAVDGRYFPILYDMVLNDFVKANQVIADMHATLVHSASVKFGSVKERTATGGMLNLNFIEPLFHNIYKAIRYASFVENVKYVNELMHNPVVKGSIKGGMNEATFNNLETWLQRVANPYIVKGGQMDGVINYFRYAATNFYLAANLDVMLVQALSIFDAIDEIGVRYAVEGIGTFLGANAQSLLPGHNLHREIMDSSVMMRDRYAGGGFNRELTDMIQSGKLANVFKGKRDLKQLGYAGIMAIDYITTCAVWLGAKAIGLTDFNGDIDKANAFADKVVRKSQPTGSIENLTTMMSGPAIQRLWTLFMSYTKTHHNRLADIGFDLFKNKELSGPQKAVNAAVSFWWLTLPMIMLYTKIKNSVDQRKPSGKLKTLEEYTDDQRKEMFFNTAKNFAGGMPLARDVVSVVQFGKGGAVPSALGFAEYLANAITKDDKAKDIAYLFGFLTGFYPKTVVDWVFKGAEEEKKRLEKAKRRRRSSI
jgi:hypothetical protein